MTTCWNVRPEDFPKAGTPDQKLRFALRYAILAPSSHNSQPWRFYQNGTSVTFVADRTRGLAVIDPYDRELIIGCGAAIMNVCIALSKFGVGYSLTAFPANAESDVVAILHLQDVPANPALIELFPAICQRVTNRGPFDGAPVPPEAIDALQAEAAAEGVGLTAITSEEDRMSVADLVSEADLAQLSDHSFRRELASWLHPSRTRDGVPGHASAMSVLLDFTRPLAGLIVRTFDIGGGIAARDAALALGSPLLVCLATAGDTQEDWLFTGQALARVLLRARLAGLDASFLNQPIEIPNMRDRLRRITGIRDNPQLMIRMGHGKPLGHTPRRPIDEVVF